MTKRGVFVQALFKDCIDQPALPSKEKKQASHHQIPHRLPAHDPVCQMPKSVFVCVYRASMASRRLIFMLGGDESRRHGRLSLLLAMINKSCFK